MPIHESQNFTKEQTTMFKQFWPNSPLYLIHLDVANLEFYEILGAMAILLICLLAILTLSIMPAWKLWQATAVLRLIPAILMLLGFIVLINLMIIEPTVNGSSVIVLRTITANFFAIATSLLLFKNENIEHADHGTSST